MSEKPTVVHAAILYKGLIYSCPSPQRHHDVIRFIHDTTGDMDIYGVQGFMDSYGEFLTREQAALTAYVSWQTTTLLPLLFSEDLW